MKLKPTCLSFITAGSCAILLLTQMASPAQTLVNRWSFFAAPAGGTTVTDSVSSVVATMAGDAYLDGTEVSLDGTSGTCVNLSSNLLAGMQSVSVEGWANCIVSGSSAHLWEFSDGLGQGNNYARYVIYDSGNSDNTFELARFSSGNPDQLARAPVGWGGVPVHVVCVYDPAHGFQAIYTNGLLEVARTFPVNQTPLSNVSSNEASLGQSPWWAYGDAYMAGTISEFRIWNGALNGLQIAALDAAGATTVSTNYGTVTNVQLQVTYQMTEHGVQQAVVIGSASGLAVKPNIASLCTFASGNTNILTVNGAGAITAVAAGSAQITAIFGAISNSQTITVAQPAAALSNRWSFYLPAPGSLTVTDSVRGAVATLIGDATLDGTGVNLDGTAGTYVDLGSGLLTGIQSLTCEGWVTSNSVSPDNVCLFSFDDGVGTGKDYFRYVLHDHGNTDNAMELANVPGEGNQLLSAAAGLGGISPLHVVCIYDPVAQVQAIFTNGALEAMRSGVTSALSGVSTNDAALGRSPWYAYGDPYLNGSISEFRIYSGELTPQQIAMDYLAGPTNLVASGPGALKSIALNVGPTMTLGLSATAPLLATYANLTNFNLTANSIFPVAGLTITSSATNIISVGANNVLTAITNGTATLTATYQGFTSHETVNVIVPPFKYNWSAPVAFNNLNADQILTNVPGIILGAAVFGGTAQSVVLSDGITTINFTSDGSVATASGAGTFTGAYLTGGTNTTGNAVFDAVLNEASYDGGPKTISLNNLTVGQYYSVQLFGLDDRSGYTSRLASFEDPNNPSDVSATFAVGDNVYVVGTFWASNTTEHIQMNLPTGNAGNINALVVRQVPIVTIQQAGANLQLAWPAGTLLEAPSASGPWTTNPATSPYLVTPTGPQKFYRVQVP